MDNANSSPTTAGIPDNNPINAAHSSTRDTSAASNAAAPQNSTPSASTNIPLFTTAEILLNLKRPANPATGIDKPATGKSQSSDDPRIRRKLKGTMVNLAPIGFRPSPAAEKGKEPMSTPSQRNKLQARTPLSGNSGGPSRPCKSQTKPPPDDNSGEPSNLRELQAKLPLDGNGGELNKRAAAAKGTVGQKQQLSEKRELLDTVEDIRAELKYTLFRLQDLTVSISQLKEDNEDDKGESYWEEQVEKLMAKVEKGDMEMLELRGRALRDEARVKELKSVNSRFGSAAAEDGDGRGNGHRA